MTLHRSTFDYLKPSDAQLEVMAAVRAINRDYAERIDEMLPEGPDKTYILRRFRELAMWTMVAISREADGSPRA